MIGEGEIRQDLKEVSEFVRSMAKDKNMRDGVINAKMANPF